MLPALYLAQHQQGYITANAMRHVAELLGITRADVEDVVSYYTMFYTRPVGKFVLQRLPDAVVRAERRRAGDRGAAAKLGIKPGQTDASGTFTLVEVECLGACDRAPVVMVNDAWHECLRPEDAGEAGRRPARARRSGAVAAAITWWRDEADAEALQRLLSTIMDPILTKYVREPNSFTLDFYLQHEGYDGAEEGAREEARRDHRAGQGLGAARPRRRRASRPG